jgi:hypothetical protein
MAPDVFSLLPVNFITGVILSIVLKVPFSNARETVFPRLALPCQTLNENYFYSISACQNKTPCKGTLNFPKIKISFHGFDTQNYQKKLA